MTVSEAGRLTADLAAVFALLSALSFGSMLTCAATLWYVMLQFLFDSWLDVF